MFATYLTKKMGVVKEEMDTKQQCTIWNNTIYLYISMCCPGASDLVWVHHWRRRNHNISTGLWLTWRRYTKSQRIYTVITKKCQASPCIIVEIFFSLVPWTNTQIFSINSPQAVLKNIDTWTFYNLWRKKIGNLLILAAGTWSHWAAHGAAVSI